jgi:hypothetical protein
VNDRPRALAVLISVLLAGCIIGAAASYFLIRAKPALVFRGFGGGAPFGRPQMGRPPARQIPETLKMNPEQQKQLNQIMEDWRKQLDLLRSSQFAKFEETRSEANKKISAILNEEQRKEFELYLGKMEEERKNRRPPRMGRGFPPMP